MKRTVVVLGLVMVAVVVALTMTSAFGWGPRFGYGPPFGYGPAGAVPALSAEQVAQLQKIRAARIADMATVRSEMFAKGMELQALLREPVPDQEKVAAKQQEIATLQVQMQEKGLAAWTAVAEILTPEQRAQMPAYGPGPGFGPGRGWGMGFGPRW